jgi:hypothetical protein
MKATILCVLLLSACADKVPYDYGLTWVCMSPDGCERTEELRLIDRLNINGDGFYFASSRDESFFSGAQRVGSDSLPAGCFWLYSLTLFGDELEPSKCCSTSSGFELELSIPNPNPATHSQWLVEIRELGLL